MYCPQEEIYSYAQYEEDQDFFEKPFNEMDKTSWTDEGEQRKREQHAKCFAPLSFISDVLREEEEERAEKKENERRKNIESKRKFDYKKMLDKERILQENEKHKCRLKPVLEKNQLKIIVDPKMEKDMYTKILENLQETIIEQEEKVPHYKNTPKDEYVKTEKVRRSKKPCVEECVFNCPYCKGSRRSIEELMKHIATIHKSEMKSDTGNKQNADNYPRRKKSDKKPVSCICVLSTKDGSTFDVKLQPYSTEHSHQDSENVNESSNSGNVLMAAESSYNTLDDKLTKEYRESSGSTIYNQTDGTTDNLQIQPCPSENSELDSEEYFDAEDTISSSTDTLHYFDCQINEKPFEPRLQQLKSEIRGSIGSSVDTLPYFDCHIDGTTHELQFQALPYENVERDLEANSRVEGADVLIGLECNTSSTKNIDETENAVICDKSLATTELKSDSELLTTENREEQNPKEQKKKERRRQLFWAKTWSRFKKVQ